MDPITAPWSAGLAKNEQKINAVIGADATVVAGKIVLGIGAGVSIKDRQQIVGVIEKLKRAYTNRAGPILTGDIYVTGGHRAADDSNITISATEPSGAQVSLGISATFYSAGSTDDDPNIGGSHFFTETVDQLIAVFLEASKGT